MAAAISTRRPERQSRQRKRTHFFHISNIFLPQLWRKLATVNHNHRGKRYEKVNYRQLDYR